MFPLLLWEPGPPTGDVTGTATSTALVSEASTGAITVTDAASSAAIAAQASVASVTVGADAESSTVVVQSSDATVIVGAAAESTVGAAQDAFGGEGQFGSGASTGSASEAATGAVVVSGATASTGRATQAATGDTPSVVQPKPRPRGGGRGRAVNQPITFERITGRTRNTALVESFAAGAIEGSGFVVTDTWAEQSAHGENPGDLDEILALAAGLLELVDA